MALANVRQRFVLAYAGDARVTIEEDERHYHVQLQFPRQERDA
jgi:hypothetical protein